MIKNLPKRLWLLATFGLLTVVGIIAHVTAVNSLFSVNEDYVAKIGDTKYETLAEAVAAVKDGETITLLTDITQDNGVQFDKSGISAKLNLDGKELTVNTGSNVNNRAIRIDNGTLEVYGGSIVAVGAGTTSSNGSGCYGAFRVEADGKLIAHDLTLSNARPWGLNVKVLGGEAELTNVTINSSYGGGIEVTEADLGTNSKAGKATLTGCTFTQTGYFDHCSTALSVSGGSELVINSGTYSGEYALYVFSSGGVITVNGGTFTGLGNNNRKAFIAAIDTNTYPQYTGGLQLKDGTFNGGFDITSPAFASVSGGTYSVNPTDYLAEGYYADNNNGSWTVQAYVAKIGTTNYYTTLQDAIDAATTGQTITILSDFTTAESSQFSGIQNPNYFGAVIEKSLTIDGQGHTITGPSGKRPFGIAGNNINVTLKDLTIKNNGSDGPTIWTCGPTTLTLDNSTVDGTKCTGTYNQPITISSNDNLPGHYTLNVTNGSVIKTNDNASAHYAIIVWSPADINISNSTLKGYAAVYVKPDATGTNTTVSNSDVESHGYSGLSNAFGMFVTESNNNTFTLTSNNYKITAGDQYQVLTELNGTTGNVVQLLGNSTFTPNDPVHGTITSSWSNYFVNSLYMDDANKELFASYIPAECTIVKVTEGTYNGLWKVNGPTPEVYYYWDTTSGQQGSNCNLAEPFDNGWLADGEYIDLMKDLTLTKNIVCQLTSGSFQLKFGEYNITKGDYSIKLATGVSAVTDKQTDVFTAAAEGAAIAETAGTGTYTYTAVNAVAQIGQTKYATLAAAIAAVQAGQTITLLANLDFSQAPYADYKWASTVNPLAITVDNVTLDLNNHTISNMGNCALGIGSIYAKDGTVSGVTIKNGTLNAGTTNNVVNSYVLLLGGAKNATIQNVTTNGGINACAESNVYIKDCSVNGTKYYTVCAQTGANVTISGTTYTKNTDQTVQAKAMFWIQGAGTDSDMVTTENLTGAFDASTITIESGNFTVDTTNDGKFFLTGNGYVAPVVKGGTYNIDPSNIHNTDCVAEGYAAVETISGTQWKVGEVVTGDLTPASESADHTEATYNVTAQVKDGNTVLETLTPMTVNVAIADANVAEGATLNDLNMETVVAKSITEVPDNTSTIDVKIAVVATPEQSSEANTLVFEVHPEATVFVNNVNQGSVELTNEDLAQNATFTFKLDVSALNLANGSQVKVVHKSSNPATYPDETFYATVADGKVSITVSHFSEFDISGVTPEEGKVAINMTTGTQYATLADAIAAATDGQTIALLQSCSGSGLFIGPNKFTTNGLTIDFNNCTYTVNTPVGSTGTENQALHFEQGNKITLTNGVINITNIISEQAAFQMFMQNYGTLIIDGMNLDGSGIAVATYAASYGAVWGNTAKPQFNYNTAGNSVIRNSTITVTGDLGIDDNAGLTIESNSVINANKIVTKGTDARYASATPTIAVENGAQFKLTDTTGAAAFETLLNANGQSLGTADANGVYTVEKAKVAEVGGVQYTTLQEAIAAATNGATVTLLEDIVLTKDVHVTTSGENIYCVLVGGSYQYQVAAKQLSSLTIDGAGHTITMGTDAQFGDKYHLTGGCAFFFGKYDDSGELEGTYTLKNITFTGFNTEIIRSAFATVNIENCTFDGNHITVARDGTNMIYDYQGALNVDGCTFTDNMVSGTTYGLIYSNNSKAAAAITINNNLFKNNGTAQAPSGGNGIIYLSKAASSEDAITNNTFEGNYVQHTSSNAAVVYLSNPVETFSGNLFKDNHVNVTSSDKKEGVIVLGSNAAGPVVGNAFVGNVLDSDVPTKRATIVVSCNSDLSNNYWGDGEAPETGLGLDIFVDGEKAITNTGFASTYTANAEPNYGVTVTVPEAEEVAVTVGETTTKMSLAGFRDRWNNGTITGAPTVTLLTNVDLSSIANWTPIGTSAKPFTGIFDGSTYTISNLTINAPTESYQALFGYVGGGATEIKNVSLVNAHVTAKKRVAGLVAEVIGDATFTNCSIDANSTITGSESNIAGLISESYPPADCTITCTNLTNYATVTGNGGAAKTCRVAGIYCQTTNASNIHINVTFTNCHNYGAISSEGAYAGGIMCAAQGSFGTETFDNCTNEGTLNGTYTGDLNAYLTGSQHSIEIVNYTGDITKALCTLQHGGHTNVYYVTIEGVLYMYQCVENAPTITFASLYDNGNGATAINSTLLDDFRSFAQYLVDQEELHRKGLVKDCDGSSTNKEIFYNAMILDVKGNLVREGEETTDYRNPAWVLGNYNTANNTSYDISYFKPGWTIGTLYKVVETVKVTFNANDSTTPTTMQAVPKGVATALTANGFTNGTNVFSGWNTVATPTTENPGTSYTDGAEVTLTENLTLYAQWDAYEVTLALSSNPIRVGTSATLTVNISKNGVALNTKEDYSAEKTKWAIDEDEHFTVTGPKVYFNRLTYTIAGANAGSTTVTYRNVADPNLYFTIDLTVNHNLAVTYANTDLGSSQKGALVEDGLVEFSSIKLDGVEVEDRDAYTFTSENENVVTVDKNGVMPVAAGTTYINVTLTSDPTITLRKYVKVVSAAAKIGDTYYPTLTKAFTAATNGQTITMLRDVTESISYTNADIEITFDLNGYTWTGSGQYALRVEKGVITVTDNSEGHTGAVTYGSDYAFIVNHVYSETTPYPRSKLILDSGTFTGKTSVAQVGIIGGNGDNTKYYGGDLVVNGGIFVTVDDTSDEHDANGHYKFTLNKKDVESYTVFTPSSITVKGGTFVNFDPQDNAAEGTGTDFTAEGYVAIPDGNGNYVVQPGFNVSFDTNGGTPETINALRVAAETSISAPDPAPTKSGSALSGWSDGTNVVTFPYTPTADVTLTAQWANAVAQIGETQYASLADAIAAVADGDEIEMIANSQENVLYDVTSLNLKNKTVTISGAYTLTSPSGNFGFYFGDYDSGNRPTTDKLNVSGITMTKSGGNYTTLFDGVTADLTNVTVNGDGNTALSYANGAVGTLTNVTVTNTGNHSQTWRNTALALQGIGAGPSEVTVKSGSYSSANGYAVYMFSSGGTVNIEGGTFSGALMAQIDNNSYPGNQAIINISGGTFTNCTLTESGGENAQINVSGGYFSINPTDYLVPGYEVETLNSGATGADATAYAAGAIYKVVQSSSIADIVLIDGEDYTFANDMTVTGQITYQRSFSADIVGNYQSWLVPFDHVITTEDTQKFQFYKVNMVANSRTEGDATDVNENKVFVHIKEMSAGETLYHNKPYIIKTLSGYQTGEVVNFVSNATDKTLYGKQTDVRNSTATSAATYNFYATYEPTTAQKHHDFLYISYKGNISWANTKTIDPYRWIIRVTAKDPNYAPVFGFMNDDDEATGIRDAEFVSDDDIEGFYTLNGVKVETPGKGVYIVKYNDGRTKKINLK